ncbi:MAG: hypothetical protein ABSF70_05765 [Terracidiphilus sp.]
MPRKRSENEALFASKRAVFGEKWSFFEPFGYCLINSKKNYLIDTQCFMPNLATESGRKSIGGVGSQQRRAFTGIDARRSVNSG